MNKPLSIDEWKHTRLGMAQIWQWEEATVVTPMNPSAGAPDCLDAIWANNKKGIFAHDGRFLPKDKTPELRVEQVALKGWLPKRQNDRTGWTNGRCWVASDDARGKVVCAWLSLVKARGEWEIVYKNDFCVYGVRVA